jgi:hypothetical protein
MTFPGPESDPAVPEIHIRPGYTENFPSPGCQVQKRQQHDLILTIGGFVYFPEILFRGDIAGLPDLGHPFHQARVRAGYNDSTEPDLVIIVGNYYLLFEAKYFSDFGKESLTKKDQITREIEGGYLEAMQLNKKFIYIAITADSIYRQEKFPPSIRRMQGEFEWTTPLAWMLDEATNAGLKIEPHIRTSLTNGIKGKLHRTRKHVYRLKSPLHRPLIIEDKPTKIHPSVKSRYETDSSYRPPRLRKLVEQLGWDNLDVGI